MTSSTGRIILVPPGPVTDKTELEVRVALRNERRSAREGALMVTIENSRQSHRERFSVDGNGVTGFSARMSLAGLAGHCAVHADIEWDDGETVRFSRTVEVLPADRRSTGLIGGAWITLAPCDALADGAFFDEPDGLREQIQAMHEIDMNVVIMGASFANPGAFYGEHYHSMTLDDYRETYAGKAVYPSKLWPARMEGLPCEDPIEVVLSEADQHGMSVLLGLGVYAMFDFSPGSLDWHKIVATELWERYGHHESVYGWYVTEEMPGRIVPHETRYMDKLDEYRADVLNFFAELRKHIDSFAPETVIMFAPDIRYSSQDKDNWRELSRNCSILCVQGCAYQQPADDLPIAESIDIMQSVLDETGSHLWLDIESFMFRGSKTGELHRENPPDWESISEKLVPADMGLLAEDLQRLDQFEFVCTFCYPGIFCSPNAEKQLGGPEAVRLYEAYQQYRKTIKARA